MTEREEPESPASDEYGEAADAPTDLRIAAALVRTAFSSEQTLMSWVRTSVSLFTFGFSITQFFYYLETQQGGSQLPAGPRRLGLALIGVGVVALVLAIIEHVARLRQMREQGLKMSRFLLPIGSAAVLLAIGIAALVFVALNQPL